MPLQTFHSTPAARRNRLQVLLLVLLFYTATSFYYPGALEEGAEIQAYLIADNGNNCVKRCPVDDLNNCEVVIDPSRLGLSNGQFYPGTVVIERVQNQNVALIVSDRGYGSDYPISVWRCEYGTFDPCTVIAAYPLIYDAPGVDIIMENGRVKGYLIGSVWGSLLCEPDSTESSGYACSEGNTDFAGLWGTGIQYSDAGNTPDYIIVTQYTGYYGDGPGIYRCLPDLSSCTQLWKSASIGAGQLKGLAVEYAADGSSAAYLVADGSKNVVWRCVVSTNTCSVAIPSTTNINSPNSVHVEPASDGTPAAWIIVDRGNSRLLRCELGATTDCPILVGSSQLNKPIGFSIEWTDIPSTTTSSTTRSSTTTSVSTTTTSTTTSSTLSSSTTTTSSTSTTTSSVTSTSSSTSSSTTTTTTSTTSTTSSSTSSTTSSSTTLSTTTTTISTTTITSSSTSTTTSSSTTSSTTTLTTSTTTTSSSSTSTTTSSSTTTRTSTTITTTTLTGTSTTTTTSTSSTSTTTTTTSSTSRTSSTTTTTSTSTSSTTSTTTTTTTVLSFASLDLDEVEHHASWFVDDVTAADAQSGSTVIRRTDDGECLVVCGIRVVSCGGNVSIEQEAQGDEAVTVAVEVAVSVAVWEEESQPTSPAVVAIPKEITDTFDDKTMVVIASLPDAVIPPSPTAFSLRAAADTSDDADEKVRDGGEVADTSPRLELVTEAVSVQLVDFKGSHLAVEGLEAPIKIGIRLNENHSTSLSLATMTTDRVTCAYWNTSTSTWATDGVEFVGVRRDGLVWCDAMHLTIFAVFMDLTFLETLLCTNLQIFDIETSQSVWKSGLWLFRAPALLYFGLLGMLGIVAVLAVWIDLRRLELWSDEFFFETAGDDDIEARIPARSSGIGPRLSAGRGLICCVSLTTLCRAARILCECRQHGSRISKTLRLSDASTACSASEMVSGSPGGLGSAGDFIDDGLHRRRSSSIFVKMSSRKERFSIAVGSVVAKHCMHANIGFHTLVAGTTLELSGLIAARDDPNNSSITWRGGMSREFIELQQTIQRHLPKVMCGVLEDSRYVTMSKLFLFWHPVFDIFCLDVKLPATRKALALGNSILGSILVALLFFAMDGALLSAESSPLCENDVEPFRLIVASILSTLAATFPVYFSVKVSQRKFYRPQDYTQETKKRQLLWWTCINRLAWLGDVVYAAALIFYTLTFLANLNSVDDPKWSVIFVGILLRWFFVIPFLIAAMEVLVIRLVQSVRPNFLSENIGVNLPVKPKLKEEPSLPLESQSSEPTYDYDGTWEGPTEDEYDYVDDSVWSSPTPPCFSSPLSPSLHMALDGPSERPLSEEKAARWGRAVSTCEILEFYNGLPSIMPSFDPRSTTVAEVARLATLPLTHWRRKLRFEILGITNAHLLEDLSAGYDGKFACHFGPAEDAAGLRGEEEKNEPVEIEENSWRVYFEEEESEWVLQSDLNRFGKPKGLSLAILKETPDFDAKIAGVTIPAAALVAFAGEVQTVTLTLEGNDSISVCDLTFQVNEVKPSLDSLFNRFHQSSLPVECGQGAGLADWVAKGDTRSPALWVGSSPNRTRFASVVAACIAHTMGLGSYDAVLDMLLTPQGQQDLLESLQGAPKDELFWIAYLCDYHRSDETAFDIDIKDDPARYSAWIAACAGRGVPQMIVVDEPEIDSGQQDPSYKAVMQI